jgi:aminopeptidase
MSEQPCLVHHALPTSTHAADRHALAVRHVGDSLRLVMEHTLSQRAIVLFDENSELAKILTEAYRTVLPNDLALPFYDTPHADTKAAFETLKPGDMVIMVQTESFQIPDYRIRVELYNRNVKVLVHGNLSKVTGDGMDYYIDSLAYDPAYYRGTGYALKARIDQATSASVEGHGATLRIDSGLEESKINIGDFSTLKNVGSQFPIGEVFTEAKDLEQVHGVVYLYAFADLSFRVNVPDVPIKLTIEAGRVTHVEQSCEAFDKVRAQIIEDEGEILVREIGFGMNRAFSRERWVRDVGAFERVAGIHLSLGAKHGVYKKPGMKRREGRHHIDVFPITDCVRIDGEVVYQHGAYCIG